MQYTQYFAPRGDYRDHLTLGYDIKQFDNTVQVAGRNAGTCDRIGSRPLSLSYSSGATRARDASLSFNTDYAQNLSGAPAIRRPTTTCATRRRTRPRNLSSGWRVVRVGADLGYRLPADWTLAARVRGQVAGQSLIAGEKFGVGGAVGACAGRACPGRRLGRSGQRGILAAAGLEGHPDAGLRRLGATQDAGACARQRDVRVGDQRRLLACAGNTKPASLALDYGVVVQGHSRDGNVTGRDQHAWP